MTPLHFISHFLLLFVCCQLCISTPTPPSSSFPSASDLWGSSATPVDVAGIDCAIRELAVSFAQSLTYTAAAPVFDALQIASLCNTTSKPDRPHDDILPYPTRRMQIHQAIGERPYPQLRKETHLSDRALKTNDQLAAARRRVEEYKYVVADSFIYFVDAATGSDSNPGTQGAPFKTILRAVQTLRYARAGITPSTSSYIFLRATATHYLASTLVLTPEDSYTIIAGWDSAAAIVSGGAPIINPTWTSQGGGVYSTQLPSSINVASDAFNVLYVNGRRAICARFPNANPEIQGLYTSPTGWMDSALSWSPRTMGKDLVEIHIAQPNRTGTQFPFFQTGLNGPADVFNPKVNFWATADPPAGGQFYTPGGLVYNATLFSPNVPNWKNAQNGIISAFHGGMWGQWAFTQLTVDSSSNSIQWAYGGFQEARGSNNGANWFVSNILAELDSAFEFYVDPATRTLYYYPNQTYPLSASFVASQLITLISVTGDADAPVTNVGLTNLQLTHSATSWLKPYEAPSGGDVSVYRGGGVFLEGTEQVEISYVQFNAISSNAICVSNYNRYAFIHDNEFIWTGDSAIVTLGSTRLMDGNSVASYPKYTTIQSNLIHELGVYTKQVAAVLSSISGYHTIRENVMFNMPRAGICLNDGFMGGHLIERNLIFNTVRETGDHGPINSWDRQPYIFQTDDGTAPGLTPAQSQSHNNFLINTYNSVWTIDHDDGSAYHYDSENVLVYGGWKCYLGHSIQAVNNVYVLPDARPGVTPGPGGWGAFCAQQFAPTPGVSGWGNEWAQNICMLGYSGIVYDQQNCNESNLKDVEPWTFNNQFYGPVAVNITCGNNAYTLPAWTKLTGFDSGSVEKGIPTVSIVQQLVKAILAM